ncbi:uncharacterized protein METZ01_LOCUS217901, partial [marine metagenome]
VFFVYRNDVIHHSGSPSKSVKTWEDNFKCPCCSVE